MSCWPTLLRKLCFCLSLHIKYTVPSTACKALYLLPAYNFNLISFRNIYWGASSKLLSLSWTSLTSSHHLTFSEADPSGWNTALALIYSFLVQDLVLDLPPPWLSADYHLSKQTLGYPGWKIFWLIKEKHTNPFWRFFCVFFWYLPMHLYITLIAYMSIFIQKSKVPYRNLQEY